MLTMLFVTSLHISGYLSPPCLSLCHCESTVEICHKKMTNAIGTLLLVFGLGLVHLACPFNHSTRHTRRFSCYRCVKGGEDNISQRGLKFSSVEPKSEESHQEQCTPWSTPLADCHQYTNEWSGLCEDVDKVMERLVSPAPESFHVLHSVISKINSKSFSGDTSTNLLLNDLTALAAFLVKPDHSIELYPVDEVVKWRLVPCQTSKSGVIHPEYLQEGEDELYHMHNALQLSRMALDIATKAPNDPQIHEISRQAEVSMFYQLCPKACQLSLLSPSHCTQHVCLCRDGSL